MPIQEYRTILTFQGDEGKYELEADFGGTVGNLVNLEDFNLTVKPSGKYRILDKVVSPRVGEPTMIVYQLARF